MSTNSEINFAFFNKEIDEIDVLQTETDIIYDFHLEADKLRLIMNKLKSLPPKFCILCQIKYIMGKNASIQILFRSLSPNYSDFVYTNLKKQYVNDSEYILCGTLQQNMSTLTPAFISRLKANKMIGVCFISIKLLVEKITTWIKQKRYLSDVLTTNVLRDNLLKYLSDKNLLKQRLVSKETKRTTDLMRPHVTFEQSKLPKDFDYTQDSFQTLCARYGREPKDCALHIIYVINTRGVVIDPTFSRKILTQSDINLSITITCGNNSRDNQSSIFRSLCSILEDLKDTIYSLEIDLRDLYLIEESYLKVAKVLKKIPNLKILKLSDGYIQWKPFLLCLKGITTLEELDLSDIRMLTDLPFVSDLDGTNFVLKDFLKYFRDIWSKSLNHLKGLRIAGDESVVSYNEKVGDDYQLDLTETVLPCLKDFTQLQSFGFTGDTEKYMERVIPFLPDLINITKLDLSGSNLGNFDECRSVVSILQALPNLKKLNLSNCYLEMRFFEIILPAIQKLNLISLDISDNEDFYPEDIIEIKRIFEKRLVLNIDD
jgi:Leucine-rich repeat (LRR) protein